MNKSFAINQFLFELGMLSRIQREGWKLIGISQPETVAEHSLRAAQIGYILALLEEYESPEKVCSMLVFHDIGECRIGDVHKLANRYLHVDESKVVSEQTMPLKKIGKNIYELWKHVEETDTIAGEIAKDADYLECAFTACEYRARGYPQAEHWLDTISELLKTRSAKQLFTQLRTMEPYAWWNGLKKIK